MTKIHKQSIEPARLKVFVVLSLFLLSFLTAIPDAGAGKDQNSAIPGTVLLLNSYHKGYFWTDEITKGVEDVLSANNVEVHVEYMDTKRQFDGAYLRVLSELLSLKYARHHYDVVITSDNNAFDFFRERGRQIYGETPMVFCGVNYLQPKELEGLSRVTGVNEKAKIFENIQLIRQLHPMCKKIIVVADDTETGKILQDEVRQIKKKVETKTFALSLIYDVSQSELISFLSGLDPDTVVLLTLFFRDRNGKFIEFDRGTQMISSAAKVPVYGTWDFQMGHGVVGGFLVDGYQQGSSAADKAVEIILGKRVEDIPILQETPDQLCFDYRQIQYFDIPVAQLPYEKKIFYEPVSFYHQYKLLIWSISSAFFLLFISLLSVIFGLIHSKKAKQIVAESKKRLSIALGAANSGIWDWNIQTGKVFFDENYFKLAGYEANGFPHKFEEWKKRVHPDDLNIVEAEIASYVAGESHEFAVEFRFKKKNDDWMWILSIGKISEFKDALPIRFTGIHIDITDRKHAEESLRKSEEQLRLVTDNMVDVITRTDEKINVIYASSSIERVFGYAPQDYLGKAAIDWIHPDDVERVIKEATEARQKGFQEVLLQYRWRQANGHYLWVESATRLLYDERGQSKGAIFSSRDITEKRAYETQLRRFETVIEQADEEVLISDPDGTIQYVNPAFEKKTGYDKKELIGKKPSILKSGLHDSLFYKGLWTTILNKKNWKGYIYNRCKNGQIILYDMGITPILDSKDNILAFASIRRDITEQTKMEQKLRQSQKMEAIGTLAGGIAHDFNNILSGIFGYANLASMNLDNPEKAKKQIELLISGAKRAAGLVQQILTFSRQTEHKKNPIKLYLIVKEAVKFIRSSIPSSIEIQENITTRSAVLADSTQIHQIVMNLCTNAFKAMEHTGGILSISLEDIEVSGYKSIPDLGVPPGSYMRMAVSDTGTGMDSDTLGRIFEPYFTTKEIGEGTGLGLAVVLGIVEEHKGYIKAYSEPDKGSTFHVYFPILKYPVNVLQPEKEKVQNIKGNEHIIIVDDEESIRISTQNILEDFGYKVTAFTNGKDAFKEFEKDPYRFDLMITDVTMPQMTGDVLSEKVSEIRDDIPIILCSGYSKGSLKLNPLQSGIRKYLQKPIDSRDLLVLIRQIFDERMA